MNGQEDSRKLNKVYTKLMVWRRACARSTIYFVISIRRKINYSSSNHTVWSILMFFRVLALAVAVNHKTGALTNAWLTFPTREYAIRKSDFPFSVVPLKIRERITIKNNLNMRNKNVAILIFFFFNLNSPIYNAMRFINDDSNYPIVKIPDIIIVSVHCFWTCEYKIHLAFSNCYFIQFRTCQT